VVSIRGRHVLADPHTHAPRILAQLHAEAAAQAGAPPRYTWGPGYWCAIKTGTWPNVTGWAESREAQRIFAAKLAALTAGGKGQKARARAATYAKAEMLARTTARKQASDEYYARLDTPTPDAEPGSDPAAPPPG